MTDNIMAAKKYKQMVDKTPDIKQKIQQLKPSSSVSFTDHSRGDTNEIFNLMKVVIILNWVQRETRAIKIEHRLWATVYNLCETGVR